MSDEYQPTEMLDSQPDLDGAELSPDTAVEESVSAPEPGSEHEQAPAADVAMAAADGAVAETEAPGADAATDTEASRFVSIAEMDDDKPSVMDRIGAALGGVGGLLKGRGWIAGVVVGLLLIALLFLPPISLAQRIMNSGGYEALSAENPSLSHPDGLTVHLADGAEQKLQLKLSSIPQAEFVAGSEEMPEDVQAAVAAVPAHLEPKSPYYQVETRSKEPGPAKLDVVIPNASEPWETLDLYAWNGEGWQWLPTRLDRDREVLVSHVAAMPASVMVMQSGNVQQRVAAVVEQFPLGEMAQVLTEADVPGMLIGTVGGLTGDATKLPMAGSGGEVALAPVVRNWMPGRPANWALVSDMLNMEADRQAHVENLVGLAQSGGYPGLVIDYQDVPAEDREVYANFVAELGAALHAEDLWLAVVVAAPQQGADGSWATGGYDWARLGAAVDQLRVVMPLAPTIYAPGGEVEQMFAWATSQVHRYKLLPIYSTLSTDGEQTMAFDDVLAPLGDLKVQETITESVAPGVALNFQLGETIAQVETDSTTNATRITVGEQSVWLGTPEWLRARMDLAARYHLGGVVLRDLQAEGNVENLVAAVADYRAQAATSSSFAAPEVVWEITSPQGEAVETKTPLTQPQLSWTAPEITGTYQVQARVAGLSKGALSFDVAAREVVTDTEGPAGELAEGEEGEEGEETASADAPEEEEEEEADDEAAAETALRAAFVTDVTVPDNTQFEKGEAFDKTWRLRNSGDRAWPESTVLVFASGDQMTDVSEVAVGEVEPGAEKDITVAMTAPDEDGTFEGVWRLQADGESIEGGGVMVIIKAGEEEQAADPPPAAPAPVADSGGFELGGHVRDLGLPYADKMHYAGMNWVKVQVHYGADVASMINTAHSKGFKIQFGTVGGPGMVVEPDFHAKYSAWVAQIAAAGADAIEVWNEPNIEREWLIGHISPQAYKELLCAAYSAIKAANPGTAVISAAPAPTGYFGGCSPNGCDDQPWMQGLYNAGGASCMDYIGAHHNAGATSPSARSGHPANPSDTHHSWFFLPQTELYYNIFGGTRKLFYTEMGYASQEGVPTFSDQFGWARGINNAQQAAWLAEAVQLSVNTGMVRGIIVWNIDFVRYGYDPQDGFAIIRPGGGCPACDALHNVLGSR